VGLKSDELIYHNGAPLVNGAFGVGKGKTVFVPDSQAEL
jgi:hypothetical protein